MNGPSRTHRVTGQTILDEEPVTNRRTDDGPEVVVLFREVVKTALAYTTHLSRLFVFRVSEGDEEVPG